jgi:hypothetical protein
VIPSFSFQCERALWLVVGYGRSSGDFYPEAPGPQVRMSRTGIGIAAPIYTLLLSLVMAETRRHDEGGRCTVAQQRLAQLRAEIQKVEQEADVACSAGVTVAPDPPRPPMPPLEEATMGAVWAEGLALPVRQPLPDAASRISGGRRRRQISGTASHHANPAHASTFRLTLPRVPRFPTR